MKSVLGIILLGMVLLLMVSCAQKKTPDKIFGEIILETEEGYQFQDFDWWIARETIKQEVPNTSYNEALDRMEMEKTYDKVVTKTFYSFQDDLFCSGEYLIILDSKADFEEILAKVKKQAESYFTKQPMSNSLQDLSIGHEVTWEGEDKSYFRI